MADTQVGTPLFIAPEVVAKSPYSRGADIFSLGNHCFHSISFSADLVFVVILGVTMLSVLLLEPDLRQLTPHCLSPSEILLFGKPAAVAAASLYTFVRYVIPPLPRPFISVAIYSDVASMQELIAWQWIRRVRGSAVQDARVGSVEETVD